MAKRQVIVELKYNRDLAEVAFAAAPVADKTLDAGAVPKIAGVQFDTSFAPTNLPGLVERSPSNVPFVAGVMFDVALEPAESTYVVRAEVDEEKIEQLAGNRAVAGVFADVEIQPTIICPGSPPMGTDSDVERLLCVKRMHRRRMDGSGVLVAIVDTGINSAHLASRGKPITLDAARSWVPTAGLTPGAAPVGHGTMCAFDAAIGAPKATFLDIQLLLTSATGPTPMSGVLSDAVRAYSHLVGVMSAPRRPGENRSMVVNNSWGMFHPSWDFPVGNTGNYSDNPNHPFNRIVATLEREGADILFAAGNCGADCPDGRCQGTTANAIYGANGHPSVLTIAGVDISKKRVGYSTQGPGRLSRYKPDLCGYTHFQGSGVYAADGGTSAATPVVAGVVAAVRTKRPYSPGNPFVSPSAVRNLLRLSAEDLGTAGFDFDHGFGVVGGCRLARPLGPFEADPVDTSQPVEEPAGSISPHGAVTPQPVRQSWVAAAKVGEPTQRSHLGELIDAAWQAGYNEARQAYGAEAKPSGTEGCGCGQTT
jgi:Subtilase family